MRARGEIRGRGLRSWVRSPLAREVLVDLLLLGAFVVAVGAFLVAVLPVAS